MMSGIVVGVDGSGHSQRALGWAMTEAAVRQVPLTVLTVYEQMRGYFGGMVTSPGDEALAAQAKQLVQTEVDEVLAKLAGPRPSVVNVEVAMGSSVEQIVNAGKDADMIVLGSRGAGGFSRMMLGSVSSLVTQHANCPVVIIPAEGR
jgi:nucleotide-binding universal stress UspA family protein